MAAWILICFLSGHYMFCLDYNWSFLQVSVFAQYWHGQKLLVTVYTVSNSETLFKIWVKQLFCSEGISSNGSCNRWSNVFHEGWNYVADMVRKANAKLCKLTPEHTDARPCMSWWLASTSVTYHPVQCSLTSHLLNVKFCRCYQP